MGLFVLDHSDLAKGVGGEAKRAEGGEYLSECAFTNTSQQDKVEEINVSFKVDGLRKEVGQRARRARENLLWGDNRRHPLETEMTRKKNKQTRRFKLKGPVGCGSRGEEWMSVTPPCD